MKTSNHILVFAVIFFTAVVAVFAQTNQDDGTDIIDRVAERISNMDDTQLQKLFETLQNDIQHLSLSDTTNAYRLVTTEQDLEAGISKLQNEKADTETTLRSAKALLADVQKKVQLLHLQPSQLKTIEDYNKSIDHQPAGFLDWLCERRTMYELIVTVLVAIGSFILGATWDVWRDARKKPKRKASKESNDSKKRGLN